MPKVFIRLDIALDMADDLEARLDRIAKNVSELLKKSEISCSNYYDILYHQLTREGIIDDNMGIREITKTIESYWDAVNKKTGAQTKEGMIDDYIAVHGTQMSSRVKIDIERRIFFEQMAVHHLKSKFQGREVSRAELKGAIYAYVRKNALAVFPPRQKYLQEVLYKKLEKQIKIKDL